MLRHVGPAIALIVVVGCVGDDPAISSTPAGSTADGGSSPPSTADRAVGCDATTTCRGNDQCCGVGTDWTGASCKPDCGGAYSLSCDDATDCPNGSVCCYVTDGGARAVSSFCAKTCDIALKQKQLCRVGSTECLTGSCTPLTQFSPNGLAACK